MKIEIGTLVSGAPFTADVEMLLRSNGLVQANSGGGKSWALRRMIEQAFGRVPQIVIDPEGEFSTLRARFDVVLVGAGGDTPADMRSAKLLAHRLLELGASAIVDLYEMKKTDRPVWVAAFVQALVDAPKALWRDLLVYVDEAHEFAPQPGHGVAESVGEKTCRSALIDLAAKGRKRGYGVVAATQRLGKLSKDFAAELKNVMVGQTFLDIDRERAAESLGVSKGAKPAFFRDVKLLVPGSFHALGRAFGCIEPQIVKVGPVQTEHPEAGRRQKAPPPPTDKIRHLLPQLADLPKEAEETLRTEGQLRARVAELERQVAAKPAPAAPPVPKVVEKRVLAEADVKRLEKVVERASAIADDLRAAAEPVKTALYLRAGVERTAVMPPIWSGSIERPRPTAAARNGDSALPRPRPRRPADGARALGAGEIKVLTAIAQHAGGCTREQLTVLTGYKRSSRDTYLQKLRAAALVDETGDRFIATPSGVDAIGPSFQPLPTGDALRAHWLGSLPTGEARVLAEVASRYPHAVDRDTLSAKTGYLRSSRDTYIQKLAARRLVEASRDGVRASAELFG